MKFPAEGMIPDVLQKDPINGGRRNKVENRAMEAGKPFKRDS